MRAWASCQFSRSLRALTSRYMDRALGLRVVTAARILTSCRAAHMAEAAQRKSEIACLDRVARANLIPCGEDRLCAELEKKGPRYGDSAQYRAIILRPSTPQ